MPNPPQLPSAVEKNDGPPESERLDEAPWLLRLPLRSPTLPPAAHTNLYVVGERDLLLVDPGTPYPEEHAHLRRTLDELATAGRRVTGIFLTHHHVDHASGAKALRAELGVPVLAHPVTAARVAAQLGLSVDVTVSDGELLPYGPAGLRALHTPGHAPGHLCLLDEAAANLIAGDMVASVGTILVAPSDGGDMGIYLDSLRGLKQLASERELRLWPAHGASVPEGEALLGRYIAHRLAREALVINALAAKQAPATVVELLPVVYGDVAESVYPIAAESLLAHLLKLAAEGRAAVDERGAWRASAAARP